MAMVYASVIGTVAVLGSIYLVWSGILDSLPNQPGYREAGRREPSRKDRARADDSFFAHLRRHGWSEWRRRQEEERKRAEQDRQRDDADRAARDDAERKRHQEEASQRERARQEEERREEARREQERAHRDRARREEPQQASATCFQILGLRSGASAAEVKNAYRRMIKQYHPDAVASLGPKLRELAEQETKRINQAYSEALARAGR